MTDNEKEELEFAHKVAGECIATAFEVKAKCRELQKRLASLEEKFDREIKKAQADTTRSIFKEMYEVVNSAQDETIIVTAEDVKRIARRYGIRL